MEKKIYFQYKKYEAHGVVSLTIRPLKLISVEVVKCAFVCFLRSQLCNFSRAHDQPDCGSCLMQKQEVLPQGCKCEDFINAKHCLLKPEDELKTLIFFTSFLFSMHP